jgi:hypothetical protein
MPANIKLMRSPESIITVGGTGTNNYSIGCTFIGAIPPNYTLLLVPFDISVNFALSFIPSQAYLAVAPSATYSIGIYANGGQIGSMIWGGGTNLSGFTGGSYTFTHGTVLTVVTLSSVDPTAANLGFILSGTKV